MLWLGPAALASAGQPGGTHASDASRTRFLMIVGALASAATVAWSGVAVFVSGRGLGLGNEGFYLLAFGSWDRSPRTFTGTQYLFGPLFDLVGHDIAALRLIRLALVLTVHAFFGVAFARWLRLQRPHAPATRAWEYCAASLIVASSVVTYSWLPPTPGYNDVTLLGCMMMVGLLLVGLRTGLLGGALPWWTGLGWGFVAGAMLLAKPPVAVSVVLIAMVSTYLLHRAGLRLAPLAVTVPVGLALFVATVQWFIAPWGHIVPPMWTQLSVVSAHSHPPVEVLGWYAESSFALMKAVLVVCAPTALAACLILTRRPRSAARQTILVLVGLAASLALITGAGGLQSGADNVLAFTSGIVAMLAIVVASASGALRTSPSWRSSTAGILGLLTLVPLLQGLGTNNALYATAVNGSAMWVAAMIIVVTRPLRPTGARFSASAAATLAAVLIAVVVGFDGLTHDGTGRSLISGPMARVSGSRELSTVALPTSEASVYSSLRRDLGIAPDSHRPMLAFGELGHYVLVLGGRPIGEAWYSGVDDGLNAADLRAACRHGNPWGGDQPLVVANREPSADERAAWRACGIDFHTEYVDVTPSSAPNGLRVLRWRPPTTTTASAVDGSPSSQ